ncbi:acyltransferase family protein [Yersinia enterocolitica]
MSKKISSLTSMRFFAALMIVIGHGSQIPAFNAFGFTLFNVGNAVSFFYVLSGFILTYNYYSMSDYKSYLIARIARIWPLHIVMLMAVIFILDYDVSDENILLANVFLIQSWFPYSSYFYSFNAVSWSISTELSFYLAFPFFLMLLKNDVRALLVTASLFLVIPMAISLFFELPVKPSESHVSASFFLYINPVARSTEFISGMIACKLFMQKIRCDGSGGWRVCIDIVSLVFLIISMTISNQLWFEFKDSGLAAFFGWFATAGSFIFIALFIYFVSAYNGICSRFLSNKFLIYFGEISFSMYMCHQVILNFINKYYHKESIANSIQFYFIYLTSVIVISAVLYHCVEVPARKLIRRSLLTSKDVEVSSN